MTDHRDDLRHAQHALLSTLLPTVSVEDVLNAVEDGTGVSIRNLKSTSQSKNFLSARQIAMYLVAIHVRDPKSLRNGLQLQDIAATFSCDEQTVLRAFKKVHKDFQSHDPEMFARAMKIKNTIHARLARRHLPFTHDVKEIAERELPTKTAKPEASDRPVSDVPSEPGISLEGDSRLLEPRTPDQPIPAVGAFPDTSESKSEVDKQLLVDSPFIQAYPALRKSARAYGTAATIGDFIKGFQGRGYNPTYLLDVLTFVPIADFKTPWAQGNEILRSHARAIATVLGVNFDLDVEGTAPKLDRISKPGVLER